MLSQKISVYHIPALCCTVSLAKSGELHSHSAQTNERGLLASFSQFNLISMYTPGRNSDFDNVVSKFLVIPKLSSFLQEYRYYERCPKNFQFGLSIFAKDAKPIRFSNKAQYHFLLQLKPHHTTPREFQNEGFATKSIECFP